jgi:hypothetical protein
MGRGRARAALVGATTVVLVGLAVGGLTRPSGGAPSTSTTSVTTTTVVTTTTCPADLTVISPSSPFRVVKIDSPRTLTVGLGNNGTVYDAPIGTVLNVRLDGLGMLGVRPCGHSFWRALSAGPPDVLRRVPGSDARDGLVASGSFEVVGTGFGTISSLDSGGNVQVRWIASVLVASVTPSSVPVTLPVTPSSLPRTG